MYAVYETSGQVLRFVYVAVVNDEYNDDVGNFLRMREVLEISSVFEILNQTTLRNIGKGLR